MSRFKRIKNKSNKKSSVSIDEKIAALNKQLKKTGMLSEEPTMNTSNIYPEVSEVPNQDLSNFEAIMTGGERLGFSGADGNTAGNASFGDVSGVSGVALSPPHPVTGVRTSAAHVRDGTGGTTPLRPGVTISRGFSDNPPQYTMGSCLWFYDMDFDNGAGQPAGKWCNLEFSNFEGETNGKWFFWDTIKPPSTLAGLYIANTDLSQHPCGDISDLIDGLNFPNGSLGPPKIPLLTQKGLETEPIYPGPIANLFGLGKRGLDWLKGKAEEFKGNFQSNTEGLGQDLKNHWGETWNDVTGFVEAIIEVGEEMADQAAGLLDGLNNLYAISDVANEAKKNGHITDDNQIKEGEKGSITNPHENFISDGTAKHILRGVDLDGPNIGAEIQSNVAANPLSGGGNWGSKGIHNNLPGKGVNPDQYPSPYKDSEGNLHIPDTYLFAKHGFLPRKYSPTGWDQEKVMGGQNPHVKFTVQGLADLNYYWSKATGSSETEAKQNAQETANGVAAFFDKSIGNILPGTVGPNSPLIHFETIIPKNQIERILGNRGITNESYISESAKLGHFEPDVLDVDINDIRKGIMPEYPKKPPAKMIDGYHEKSRIKPKEAKNIIPTLKIDKTDLIRNHRIKPSEVDEMMKTINMINDYIKKHPEDFIYAQQRYPVDDPRLAELNWKMDQMLDASKDYLDSNFKENKKLFKRATEHTLKNIKVTDPKYVQQHYDELRGTNKPKKTKLVGRLGKHLNKYESKSLFKHVNSKDFKKISERKLEKEKFLEKQEQERLDYINDINAEMDEFRSDWRNELKEQPAFKAVPIDTGKMTSSQSFAIFPNFPGSSDTGIRLGLDGGLGRDNSLASTDTGLGDPNFTGIFQFPTEGGGFVPAISFKAGGEINSAQISYGDFPLSGYAMPLGGEMYRSITQRKKEEINKELDSSEEYTKQIKADALMKARVGDGPAVVKIYKASDFTPGEGLADRYPPEELQKLSVKNPQKFSEYKHIFDIADEMTKKVETSFEKIDQEYSSKWEPKLSSLLPSNQYSDLYKKHGGSAFNEVNIEINRLNYEEHKAMTRVKTKDGIKLRSNKKSNAIRATANKISDAIPILQELQNKLDDIRQSKMDVVEAENRRETKALQKVAPEFFFPHGELKPLDLYMEPFGADLKTMSDIEKYAPEPTTNIVSQEDEEWLNSQSTLVDFLQYLKPFGIPSDFGKFGIQYARGDDTPIRKFSGGMNKALEGIFIKKYKKNPELFENGKKVGFSYKDYGAGEGATIIQKGIDALRYPNIRLGLGTFVMSVNSNGVIRVEDTFNVDKLFTTVGAFDMFDLQNSANRITKIAHQRRGVVGDDDKGGIPVDVKFRSLKMKKLLQKEEKNKEKKDK